MSVERRGCVKQPEGISQLSPCDRRTLCAQAKQFAISKWDVHAAYEKVKANRGGAGIDGVTIEVFEQDLKNNLYKIWNRLSSGSYFPPPVKAVSIPKKSGGERILGIPTISDRIAQMVVKERLELMLEPCFLEDSYGYRPAKSATQAIGVTRQRCWKYDWVLEFDIKGLFDNIRHDLLMIAIEKHVAIGEKVLGQNLSWIKLYIRRWLVAPLQQGNGSVLERNRGTPQGGVVSPLLANLFLHYVFDKWMQKQFPENPWCRYADDGLIHARNQGKAEYLHREIKRRFEECGLEIHPEKTKIAYCKDDKRKGQYAAHMSFDFLGYTFRRRRCKRASDNTFFVSFTPAVSQAAMKDMRRTIRELKVRHKTGYSLEELARWLNPVLHGWISYYGQYRRSALDPVFRHFNKTLVRWARRKFKTLKRHKSRAIGLFDQLSLRCPGLFAHWRFGSARTFA
ncbi:group II intron reverse transcriptase/maturase [Endozoicomonas numazuensis]|uniref:RNA-directed DNA polymerase n=1 Tax=Endozoicomonas numazuensis TaxID=1137799 RepID=A0A081NEH0_9GAMM|nr:group II intron reverse transcriptase/maturase [Endozoicomonas numazuensis]KEQ16843.1 DNA polymerase [Endozoicomonas numazuensis]